MRPSFLIHTCIQHQEKVSQTTKSATQATRTSHLVSTQDRQACAWQAKEKEEHYGCSLGRLQACLVVLDCFLYCYRLASIHHCLLITATNLLNDSSIMSRSTLQSFALVTLSTDDFVQATARYIDNNKPDPLATRQIQSWTFDYQPHSLQQAQEAWSQESSNKELTFEPEKMISGRLTWQASEYIQLHFDCTCAWRMDESATQGDLHFVVTVKADFVSDTKSSIHKKMTDRLRQDAYIKKLLTNKSCLLLQAMLHIDKDAREERTSCDMEIAEAIQRAAYSSAESTLDVIDFVVSLPVLPCTSNVDKSETSRTFLADRARLRLLEDATCDACERQDEEEMVSDLKIGADKEACKEGEEESTAESQPKKSKRGRAKRRRKNKRQTTSASSSE
jgi:hypothetical protein